MAKTETDRFLENYKRFENVLHETGQGSVLDFENAHQTDNDPIYDKLKVARIIRNFLAHHPDGTSFITATPAMTKLMENLADREEAQLKHVKDVMTRQRALTVDMYLKDVLSAVSKSKFHWAAVVDKNGIFTGFVTSDMLLKMIADKGSLTGKLSAVYSDAAVKRKMKEVRLAVIDPDERADELYKDSFDIIVVCDEENKYKGIVK